MARKANIYNELTDGELIEKFNEFDATAFEEIYDRYWLKMFYHASRMLSDADQAGDFVQDVFLKLLSLRGRLEAKSLPAFLYTSTRNLILDAIRHEKVKDIFFIPVYKPKDSVHNPTLESVFVISLTSGEQALLLFPNTLEQK